MLQLCLGPRLRKSIQPGTEHLILIQERTPSLQSVKNTASYTYSTSTRTPATY